jgi:hypothetical protein
MGEKNSDGKGDRNAGSSHQSALRSGTPLGSSIAALRAKFASHLLALFRPPLR